jgi:hypothetical protein
MVLARKVFHITDPFPLSPLSHSRTIFLFFSLISSFSHSFSLPDFLFLLANNSARIAQKHYVLVAFAIRPSSLRSLIQRRVPSEIAPGYAFKQHRRPPALSWTRTARNKNQDVFSSESDGAAASPSSSLQRAPECHDQDSRLTTGQVHNDHSTVWGH